MNMPAALELGAFGLEHRIAYGGMGEIWRGHHRHSGQPVAVKVLTGEYLREPSYHADFKREVQATAALHHPNVVLVFDYGLLPEGSELVTQGELLGGSPYLVMELASRGSLDRIRLPLSWLDFRRIVTALLSALAHAHARGFIHRDIKPGNILLGSTDDPRPSLKLTDFGIAHSIARHRPSHVDASPHGTVEDVLGTPWYMAPEQLMGLWRDYGPWTDLYALGIVAWELASGEVPFDGKSPFDIGMAHIENPLPVFDSRMDSPPGLEEWLRTLLEKEFGNRFSCAADALHAFTQLGDPRGVVLTTGPQFRFELPKAGAMVPGAHTESEEEAFALRTTILREPVSTVGASQALQSLGQRPPVPHCWRDMGSPAHEVQVSGAGLGLVGLRSVPFVGRENERDIMWGCLRRVVAQRQTRVVVLRGAAGMGKSRLAEWLACAAEQSGAANVLRARHESGGGVRSGLARMVAEHFRLIGLRADEHHARLRTELVRLSEYDPLFTNELCHFTVDAVEAPDDETRQAFAGRAVDRHRLVARLMERVTALRPALMILDDAHFGAESLEMLTRLLADSSDMPLFVIVTVREDELARNREAHRILLAIEALEGVTSIDVGPLSTQESGTLVDVLLGLRADLREKVIAKVDGNPLFATQLVSDWVERQSLNFSTGGFALVDEQAFTLPDDLYAIWRARLEAIVVDDQEWRSVEIAAALGREFTTNELQRACAAAEVDLPTDLVARLVRARLVTATEHGWSFAHSMLREAIHRTTHEQGLWQKTHAACADAFAGDGPIAFRERHAYHLLQAERWHDAEQALWFCARSRNRAGEPAPALQLLQQRFDALRGEDVPESDARYGASWSLQANIELRLGNEVAAEALAGRVLECSSLPGWQGAAADAEDALAFIARSRGRYEDSHSHSHRALALFEDISDREGTARAKLNLGYTELSQGQFDTARETFTLAREGYLSVEDSSGAARASMAIARVLGAVGDVAEAQRHYLDAGAVLEAAGAVALARQCREQARALTEEAAA
ncbi:MAG: serine/threonine protein kinase/tetratricopeptide (TPR) repeat protein [Bradymonadia bacterium]|jgi:serine/threonine protein kinase/tetratricopeptide (TPR) repeat protein